MTPEDRDRLQFAKNLLENPGLAAKLTNITGMPFEKALEHLPARWTDNIQGITQKALKQALYIAVTNMGHNSRTLSSKKLHKLLVAASGGIGGALINSVFMDHFQNMARAFYYTEFRKKIWGENRCRAIFIFYIIIILTVRKEVIAHERQRVFKLKMDG